jgi:hypothetical protein
MHYHLLAQLIGFVAVGFSLLVFQVNNRKTMLTLTIIASVIYTCHFYLLGAYTGSLMNLIGAGRGYAFRRHPKLQSRKLFLILVILFCIAAAITWNGPVSLLPLCGMIAGSFALWQVKTKKIRGLALIAPPLWFTYNVIVGSYPGMLIEVINIGSNLIGIYRFDIQKTKPKAKRQHVQ